MAHIRRLIKRATVVARMFYHTALIVLTQTNPMMPISQQEVLDMQAMQLENARECCGIIAHVKDRYVVNFNPCQEQRSDIPPVALQV